MNPSNERAFAALLMMSALSAACGSDAPSGAPSGGAGSAGTAAGGGSALAGSAGQGVAGQGVAGASGGSAGSGGLGGGTAGSGAGSAGASAGSGGAAAACVKAGTQADPGTTGDGKVELMAPYPAPPESLDHLNGAPKGKVNGVEVGGKYTPLIYAGKTQYPGVTQMLKYEYWIYVPAQYKPGCAAALMVFQDGLHYVGIDDAKFNTPTVFDNLIHSGDMPVTIALFINPGEPGTGHYDGQEYQNRHVQYDKNDTTYVNFLVDEFLPANVLTQYDIVTDPDGWGIGGHSSGGIAAFMAGWYRPEKFRKLLTHSASFPNTGNNNGVSLMQSVDASEPKPLRVYLMSGPNDLGNGSWYNGNTTAAGKLAAKGYHYQYRVESNTHYPPLAGVFDLPSALRWMWRGYELQ